MTMSQVDILTESLRLLRHVGWGQGRYRSEATGCMCMTGGVRMALFGSPYRDTPGAWDSPEYDEAMRNLAVAAYTQRYVDQLGWNDSDLEGQVIAFNDSIGTTFDKVADVFETAIAMVAND